MCVNDNQCKIEIIKIDDNLRLRKYDGNHCFALKWYQNLDTVFMVDGVKKPYSKDKLNQMYNYLNENMELFFIEILDNGEFLPIGDVSFSELDMPIVIGDISYQRKGIGKKVILSLIDYGKSLGLSSLHIKEIYEHNIASQKMFESVGFIKQEKTKLGFSYKLYL